MWRVTLRTGAEMELWADSYSTEPVDDHWEFGILADATPDEQQQIRIDGRTVPRSDRCNVIVARIPVSEVDSIEGGWPLTEDPRLSNDTAR